MLTSPELLHDSGTEWRTDLVRARQLVSPQWLRRLLDAAQVLQLLTQAHAALVSVRIWSEYIGQTSGYNYIEAHGRALARPDLEPVHA